MGGSARIGSWAVPLRTLAFRVVLFYAIVFALSSAAIVGFTYWNTKRALDAGTDQVIQAEITGLAEQYQRLGLAGLTDAVRVAPRSCTALVAAR